MKITKATFKSFIKKNEGKLFVNKLSSFDGMTDCVESCRDNGFKPAAPSERSQPNHTLGISGVWLVNGGGDYFTPYDDGKFIGIEFYNCCGQGIVAIEKNTQQSCA